MSQHVAPPYDPARSIAKAAEQAVETYGQTGDAEKAMQRLCAAVNEHRKGQGT